MSDQYKDNFWGPSGFDTLEKRVNQGTESTRLFLYFMKERAAIEESYAKSLQKLLKNTSEISEYGTLRDAWYAVRGECESLVRVHHELGQKIDKDIVSPFEKFKSEQKKVKKNFLHDGYKLNRERKDMESNINKYKQKYDDYSKQAENMAIQMETAKSTKTPQEISKIQVKLQKLQKEAHLFEQDYKDAVNKLSTYQPQWEEKVSSNYHTLQLTEEERIDYIKVQLEKYVGAIKSTVPDTETTNRNLVKVVALIDKIEDIQCFVRESRTGTEPPPPPSFISYGGKASSDYIQSKSSYTLATSTSSSSFGSISLNKERDSPPPSSSLSSSQSKPQLTSSYSSNSLASGSTVNLSKSAPPAVAQRSFSNSNQKKVVALYDYVGSDATELDFFAGDIITVVEEDESGWNVGQLGDRSALYPSNYCKDL